MPKLGLTMSEGVIVEWRVATGNKVNAGDIIFVVETEKSANEIGAAERGIIEGIHVEAGGTVSVGDVVATLAVENAVSADMFPTALASVTNKAVSDVFATGSEPRRGPESTALSPSVRPIATPLARRLARRAGLDVSEIKGSGPGGRVIASDLNLTISMQGTERQSKAPEALRMPNRGRLRPLDPHQKVVARRLTEAKRDIPHFYIFADADVTDLLELRSTLNARPGHDKLTITHFVLAALARALAASPAANASP